jgi:hypothetical protein
MALLRGQGRWARRSMQGFKDLVGGLDAGAAT